jgi:hypothetical protein
MFALKRARLWAALRSTLVGLCMAALLGYFYLWNAYYDVLPSAEDRAAGRVYADNFHGRVLYENSAERFRLHALSSLGEILAVLAISAEALARRKSSD